MLFQRCRKTKLFLQPQRAEFKERWRLRALLSLFPQPLHFTSTGCKLIRSARDCLVPRSSAGLMMLCSQAALKHLVQKTVAAVEGAAIPSWREVANPRAGSRGEHVSAAPGLSRTHLCSFTGLSWPTVYLKQMWGTQELSLLTQV